MSGTLCILFSLFSFLFRDYLLTLHRYSFFAIAIGSLTLVEQSQFNPIISSVNRVVNDSQITIRNMRRAASGLSGSVVNDSQITIRNMTT